MSRIENRIPFSLNKFQKVEKEIEKLIEETQVPTANNKPKEKPTIRVSLALEILEGKNVKSEKFADVRAEMDKNVPDRTTTIEEKEKAISYIDRMLNCDDISSEMKEYWSNKRDVIQMEIESIKNHEKSGENEKLADVQKEFDEFLEKYSHKPSDNLADNDKKEYNITFLRTCISFYQRLLGSEDLSDESAIKYQNKIQDLWKSIQSLNVTYFDYGNYQPQIKIAYSIDDVPQGSHNTIKDARGYDISRLNLSLEELLSLCIDKTTVLSSAQQTIIDEYMEKMKDPGLGISDLHEQGITGRGIKMAIIDQPLGYHQEYGSNILENNDINCNEMGWTQASMHGAAVTSIAVGKNTGVAPDADLIYYSAVNSSNDTQDKEFYKSRILAEIESLSGQEGVEDYISYLQEKLSDIENSPSVSSNKPYVEAINRILDKNEKLPPEERVTVISISWGFDRFAAGYDELQQALQRAKEQGVFIVSTALREQYGFNTCGANRNPLGDVNNPNNYEAGAFWKDYPSGSMGNEDTLLLFPMDHRTVADYTDGTSYRYEGNDGGMSWSTPWLAGMYVLAKQVDFSITPEEFWELALETSDECRNNDTGEYIGRIINPQALIEAIRQRKEENS